MSAPIAVRRALVAPRYLVHCHLCPVPRWVDLTLAPWPGVLVGHEKRPGAAADVGRAHLKAKHPEALPRPGLSPDRRPL